MGVLIRERRRVKEFWVNVAHDYREKEATPIFGEPKDQPLELLSDEQVDLLVRCTCLKCRDSILKNKEVDFNWRHQVLKSVHQIIHTFYCLPVKARSCKNLLAIIQRCWDKKTDRFFSPVHYYMTLAQVTDHLLYLLSGQDRESSHRSLRECISSWIPGLNLELTAYYQLVEWRNTSYKITKFVVDEHAEALQAIQYTHLLVTFQFYGRIPEEIEIRVLLTGKRICFYPKEVDLSAAVDYLYLLMESLRKPLGSIPQLAIQ